MDYNSNSEFRISLKLWNYTRHCWVHSNFTFSSVKWSNIDIKLVKLGMNGHLYVTNVDTKGLISCWILEMPGFICRWWNMFSMSGRNPDGVIILPTYFTFTLIWSLLRTWYTWCKCFSVVLSPMMSSIPPRMVFISSWKAPVVGIFLWVLMILGNFCLKVSVRQVNFQH